MALELYIKGQRVTDPKEWKDLTIKAAFGTNTNQPSIESDRLTLSKDAAQKVIDHVNKGMIFEELPSNMVFDGYEFFNGFLDTSDDYEEESVSFGQGNEQPVECSVKFKKDEAIQYFSEKINGVSYYSLYEEGLITDSDFKTINTIIRRRLSFTEVAIALLSLFLIAKEIPETIRRLKKSIAEVVGIATGSTTGSFAAAVYAIVILILELAYTVAMFALLTQLVLSVIQMIIPPRVKNKGMSFRKLLEKACEKFGYSLNSNIKDLDNYFYLPSKPYQNSNGIEEKKSGISFFLPINRPNKRGIPNESDYGYLLNEMFDLCSNMFNARTDVVGDVVQFHNADDEYWFKQSTFTCPINLKLENKRYNTSDLPQTRMISFSTDVLDEWTIENFTGTNYEIKTETATGNLGTIKGLDKIQIPMCLPNSKTKRNALEEIAYQMAKACDELVSLLGKKSSFASDIDSATNNILMVSSNQFNIPKVVLLDGSNVPANHRERLSAKYLYETYHFGKSFVTGDKLGQKIIYNGLRIPFNVTNLQETINNGAFILPDGRKARFKEITYLLGSDEATVDIEVQEVYTDRLKEVYYEP